MNNGDYTIIQTNIICPFCLKDEVKVECIWLEFLGTFDARDIKCPNCGLIRNYTKVNHRFIYNISTFCVNYPDNLTESQMAVNIFYEYTHNNLIVEMSLSTHRKGEWKAIAEPFLNVLKAYVPASHRSYDPNTKKWEISANYFPAIEIAAKPLNIKLNLISVATDQTSNPLWSNDPSKIKVDEKYAENFFYEDPAPTPTTQTKESVSVQLGKILGIEIAAQSIDELRKIYRKKALELHPDRNNGDGSRMSELNSLWSVYCK